MLPDSSRVRAPLRVAANPVILRFAPNRSQYRLRTAGKLGQNLVVFGKAVHFVFGENHLSVHDDIEDPAAAFDEFRLDAGVLLDRIRQTGGLGRVVSLYAILNGNVHVGPLFRRSLVTHACPLSFIQ